MRTFAGLAEIVMRVRHADGRWSARPIWVVAIDGEACIRSAFGRRSAWYRRVQAHAATEVDLGGVNLPVRLEPVDDPALVHRVSAAYRTKYALSWPSPVEMMISPEAARTTMRLTNIGEVSELLP
ncbi:DUF2255 family protein [Nonomuraea basaltis]|uniref:DUF2255 family protein n=1 Tax=Nonomuraea basaltis TaxID=2495887 RepID=UPI00110C4E9C|nr:DUF2255 family protein [Nonomuraea basaltis]TMR92470.1 DUF2255 family protein [Nonomuraea basaltis]